MKYKTILLCIALALLCLSAKAEVLRCTIQEKDVYLANKELVDSMLDFRSREEVAKIYHFFNVPEKDMTRLVFFVRNREFKYICQDILYKDSLDRRVKNKITIERVFQDSINTILIPTCQHHISGENLSYALHCRNMLNLDSAQYAYIMDKALSMARRIRKDYRVNLWNEEMEVLRKTLDKGQLWSFFRRKNYLKVLDEFDKAWDKLKEADLTEQLDSAKDAKEAIKYMHCRQMIKDLYRGYGTSQKKYLAELDKSKPKMMRMLDGIDKKARVEEKRKTVGKEFVW